MVAILLRVKLSLSLIKHHAMKTNEGIDIQSVQGGKVNILGGHSIAHSKRKEKVYMYKCPIPNGFGDRAISLYSTLYTVQTSNTPCPHTVVKYIVVGGGIFENVLY
jgi:hypothetical protein